MDITCIADLHGHYPKLDGGDLLIVGGDLTRSDEPYQYEFLYDILKEKNYKKIILIAGNHDNCIQNGKVEFTDDTKIEYLCDSGTEFEGLKIWGSPWTPWFPEVNPKCSAFMLKTEEKLKAKWDMIPSDTDILITHGPPYSILDKTDQFEHVGSHSLCHAVLDRHKLKLHIFGHIHEAYGEEKNEYTRFINCSHVNEDYHPVNNPVRIEI